MARWILLPCPPFAVIAHTAKSRSCAGAGYLSAKGIGMEMVGADLRPRTECRVECFQQPGAHASRHGDRRTGGGTKGAE